MSKHKAKQKEESTDSKKRKLSETYKNGVDAPSERKHAKKPVNKTEKVVRDINVEGFAESRALEIQALSEVVKNVGGNHMAFQKLPRHMRRRAMSHNLKRVPHRLHDIVKSEIEKTKPPGKRPSRRYRRKPSNLLAEYERRKRRIGWLETHIWHAKRFKMVEKWGYQVPFHPNDKSIRACYRAVARHCLMQDVSYESYIEIRGPRQKIIDGLAHLTTDKTGPTFASKMTSLGTMQGRVVIYSFESYPKGVIGPVTYLWRPEMADNSTKDQQLSTLWICCHPSFYSQVWDEINKCFDQILQVTPGSDQSGAVREVSVNSLKHQLMKFRLSGPASNVVLAEALHLPSVGPDSLHRDNIKPHGDFSNVIDRSSSEQPLSLDSKVVTAGQATLATSFWWEEFYSVEKNLKAFAAQSELWARLIKCHSPAEAPPNCVLALTVRDPRLLLPPKRNKVSILGSGSVTNSLPLEMVTEQIADSPLWNIEVREEVKSTKISEQKLNEMKSKQLLPGKPLNLGKQESRIPILLVQRLGSSTDSPSFTPMRHGYSSGWDIIVPSGWAMAFWVALVYRGARVGGIKEAQSTALHAGMLSEPFDFPDSSAGKADLQLKSEALQTKHNRRPPAKRPNYAKLGFPSPFKFEFNKLVNEWQEKCSEITEKLKKSLILEKAFQHLGNSDTYILRERKMLRLLNSALVGTRHFTGTKGRKEKAKSNINVLERIVSSNAGKDLVENHLSALVPVKLLVLHRGVPAMFGHVCVPTAEDLKQLDNDKSYSGPLEGKHKDPFEAKRQEERKERIKLRKKKKRGKKVGGDKDMKALQSSNPTDSSTIVEPAKTEITAIVDEVSGSSLHLPKDTIDPNDAGKEDVIPTSLLNHTARSVIGFIQSGDFDLGRGQGSGLGFCSVAALLLMLEEQSNRKYCLVLIRNPTSLQYRFASVSIVI